MEYDYIKSRALDQKEKNRLRLSIKLERHLRSLTDGNGQAWPADPRRKTSPANPVNRRTPLIEELLSLFSCACANENRAIVDWALCYTSPKVLRRLMNALAEQPARSGALGLIQQGDPSLLLPRDYITPDLQRFQRSHAEPETALVCFTGNAQRLNMPVQLFHILAIRTFDLVVYLRDDKKQRFTGGIPGLGTDLEELGDSLSDMIPGGCHTAILSASSGGVAASRIAEALTIDRMALFSPEFAFKNISAISDETKMSAENTRLFFARNNAGDAKLAAQWSKSHLGDSIRWLDTRTHGTLTHLVYAGDFQALANWLGGDVDRVENHETA
jgi:hypothetical protein